MKLLTKLRALLRRPQPPVVPPALVADAEFLESVARLARERYAQHPAGRGADVPRPEKGQAA